MFEKKQQSNQLESDEKHLASENAVKAKEFKELTEEKSMKSSCILPTRPSSSSLSQIQTPSFRRLTEEEISGIGKYEKTCSLLHQLLSIPHFSLIQQLQQQPNVQDYYEYAEIQLISYE